MEVVDGRPVLLFDCMTAELSPERRAAGERGGIWVLELDDLTGPYDVGRAHLLHDESLYVGKLVRRRDGEWCLLAFRNVTPDGFVGEITDPIPVRWDDGRLGARSVSPSWCVVHLTSLQSRVLHRIGAHL